MPEASLPRPLVLTIYRKPSKYATCRPLWDQISDDPGALPVPESHLRLAEERLKRYREDPSSAHSAFEVLDCLANKSKPKEALPYYLWRC